MTEVAAGTAGALLAGLDPEQREVALAARGAVCVLAGAGAGKTRAITHRIAYAAAIGVVDPTHVLALTFTVRAAGELRGRLRQLGAARVRASTFHAAALRQLNYFWPRVVGGRPPRLIDSKAALVREAARRSGSAWTARAWPTRPAKSSGPRPPGPPGGLRPRLRRGGPLARGRDAAMAAVYDGYERLRRERQLVDFESVLELTAAIVLEHRGAADQVRGAFRYFVVDEYQDVNPLQKLLLDAWLGDRDDLCVVGDPRQVIYSFTGATPAYLTGFSAEFPDATVVRLARDYRSTPQVVAVANQLIRTVAGPGRPAPGRAAAGAHPVRRRTRRGGRAGRPNPGSDRGGRPGRADRGAGPDQRRDRAIRAGAGAAGVPYVCAGRSGSSNVPWSVRPWSCSAGPPAARRQDALPAAVRDVLTGIGFTAAPPAGARRPASAGSRWPPWPSSPTTCTRPGRRPALADFAAELTQRAELGHTRTAGRHARVDARGQGPGVGRGAAARPGRGADADRARPDGRRVDEERRLLYVAVTRASEHLYLSWSPARAPGTRGTPRQRSRFLDDLRLGRRPPEKLKSVPGKCVALFRGHYVGCLHVRGLVTDAPGGRCPT